jgi:hypothetical protein
MPGFCSFSALGGGAVIGTRDISAYPAPPGIYQKSRPGEGRPEPIRQARSTPGPGPHCGAPFAPCAGPSIGSPALRLAGVVVVFFLVEGVAVDLVAARCFLAAAAASLVIHSFRSL